MSVWFVSESVGFFWFVQFWYFLFCFKHGLVFGWLFLISLLHIQCQGFIEWFLRPWLLQRHELAFDFWLTRIFLPVFCFIFKSCLHLAILYLVRLVQCLDKQSRWLLIIAGFRVRNKLCIVECIGLRQHHWITVFACKHVSICRFSDLHFTLFTHAQHCIELSLKTQHIGVFTLVNFNSRQIEWFSQDLGVVVAWGRDRITFVRKELAMGIRWCFHCQNWQYFVKQRGQKSVVFLLFLNCRHLLISLLRFDAASLFIWIELQSVHEGHEIRHKLWMGSVGIGAFERVTDWFQTVLDIFLCWIRVNKHVIQF